VRAIFTELHRADPCSICCLSLKPLSRLFQQVYAVPRCWTPHRGATSAPHARRGQRAAGAGSATGCANSFDHHRDTVGLYLAHRRFLGGRLIHRKAVFQHPGNGPTCFLPGRRQRQDLPESCSGPQPWSVAGDCDRETCVADIARTRAFDPRFRLRGVSLTRLSAWPRRMTGEGRARFQAAFRAGIRVRCSGMVRSDSVVLNAPTISQGANLSWRRALGDVPRCGVPTHGRPSPCRKVGASPGLPAGRDDRTQS